MRCHVADNGGRRSSGKERYHTLSPKANSKHSVRRLGIGCATIAGHKLCRTFNPRALVSSSVSTGSTSSCVSLSFQEFRTVLQERQKRAENVKELTDGTRYVWLRIVREAAQKWRTRVFYALHRRCRPVQANAAAQSMHHCFCNPCSASRSVCRTSGMPLILRSYPSGAPKRPPACRPGDMSATIPQRLARLFRYLSLCCRRAITFGREITRCQPTQLPHPVRAGQGRGYWSLD